MAGRGFSYMSTSRVVIPGLGLEVGMRLAPGGALVVVLRGTVVLGEAVVVDVLGGGAGTVTVNAPVPVLGPTVLGCPRP
jgi:hypothetical protein